VVFRDEYHIGVAIAVEVTQTDLVCPVTIVPIHAVSGPGREQQRLCRRLIVDDIAFFQVACDNQIRNPITADIADGGVVGASRAPGEKAFSDP